MIASRVAVTVLFLLLVGTMAAEEVEIHLGNGRVVTGEMVSENDDQVVIKSTFIGKSGSAMSITTTLQRDDIQQIVRLPGLDETYRKKLAAAKTGNDFFALAQWCKSKDMLKEATQQAEKAVALDPSLSEATAMLTDLGWMLQDGTWQREADVLAKEGKVRYDGKIMTLAEADELRASEKEQGVLFKAQHVVDERTHRIDRIDHELAALKKRDTTIAAELDKNNTVMEEAQLLVTKANSTKSAMDAAQKALDAARASQQHPYGNNAFGGGGGGPDLTPLVQAAEDTQKAYYAARDAAVGAEDIVARCKAKVVTLNEEKKRATKLTADLNAKRELAVKDLDKASAALAQLKAANGGGASAPGKDATSGSTGGATSVTGAGGAAPGPAGTDGSDPGKSAGASQ